MGYRMRRGLFFCVTGGRSIFLDVEADRYFGIKPGWDQAFQALVADDIAGPELSSLIDAGILVEDDAVGGITRPPAILPATKEMSVERVWPISGLGLRFIIAQIEVVIALRTRTFSNVLRPIADHASIVGPGRTAGLDPEWKPFVSAFFSSSALRPRSGHCLTNSIAFMRVAQSLGFKAELVLGVCAAPFSAHCWVQADGHVLNDRLENIRNFEPILTI
ncbi:lasso peptide biosynthesis B2 protein [Sphingobium sp. CFD-2]|uniref:lasso peptide biosynthesis B2 protein n=1 Tax=Sphingobium sp. CFD-2 TaxID=2878542 RepID=UPI00214B7017|nr:lasso peptide biosynthesis B2 protein [Sphingobium sp. CFD-2]